MNRLVPFLVLLLAGCGAGSGGGGAPGLSSAAAGVPAAIDQTRAQWQVVDLASGQVSAAAALPGLAGDPAYRDRLMAFRLVPGGAVALGGGAFARQDDELARTAVVASVYVAACECTRAQWRRIAGDAPWDAVRPVLPAGEDLPATGLSFVRVGAALAAWNAGGRPRLGLPAAEQWEAAARAGSTASFPWGEDRRASVAAAWAVTWESGAAPRAVGGRQANAWGLHDVCGNAAELVADGSARGGGWADPLSLARPANRWLVEPDTGHAQVGVRLVYLP
ncbi:MAG: SUMF1/EgtB/PvdO family nonheme iron enzyme [Planctomycetes bacterium]|nr:SUMF1/EgtB/PvdO family nonheme iron enzyme [Planctomycetota bacterium]